MLFLAHRERKMAGMSTSQEEARAQDAGAVTWQDGMKAALIGHVITYGGLVKGRPAPGVRRLAGARLGRGHPGRDPGAGRPHADVPG